jgi:translation initiation factor IF-3-like protein
VRFRGRESTHPEVAREQIGRIAAGVADIAIVERAPSMEGRSMFAILARGRAQGQPAQAGQGQAAPRVASEAAPKVAPEAAPSASKTPASAPSTPA